MPLDLHGFYEEPNKWEGLFKAAEIIGQNKARQAQLAQQEKAQRTASGAFLQNYLDPKDYLSGTPYDPVLLQGLQSAKQEGLRLAMQGADSPTLMTALGPMVNKLSAYSINAKTINKQVDDQIKLMRESGLTGYDYSAIKDAALKEAFYKTDEKGRQTLIDPSEIDPSANYIQRAIEANPDKLTTAAGLDLFAKNSPMSKTLSDIQKYSGTGELDRSKVHLIGQTWLEPERDAKGRISGLVPKHDIATEQGRPLIYSFTNESGQQVKAPVRLLSEDVFDDMMQRRPDIADYMKGIVKQHIGDYKDPTTGQPISLNDPKAKLVARAIAYDELNRRKTASVERADIVDKPSQAMINLKVQQSPEYVQKEYNVAAARKAGRSSVLNPNAKASAVEVIIRGLKGDSDILQGDPVEKDGSKVYDITSIFSGGGLSAGRGADFKYKGIFIDPGTNSLIVEKETKDRFGIAHKESEKIAKENIPTFLHKIAQSNGVGIDQVDKIIQKLGFGEDNNQNPAADFNNRQNSWRNTFKNPFGQSFTPNQ